MKRRVSSMKIPCRIWLLAATLSVGQAAFSTEMETISFSTGQDIAQQKKVIEVTGTVTDNFGPVIGATVTVKGMSVQSPNQKIPDRKTKCVIKTHINIKQNVIFSAKLKPV